MTNESTNDCIGLKIGSMNTAVACRNNKIRTKTIRTCVRYPKDLNGNPLPPLVGEQAAIYADAYFPLNLGVVETEEGIQHTKHILETLHIPENKNIVLAAPAVEITSGEKRLAKAVRDTCSPKNMRVFSECLSAAVYVLNDPKKILDSVIFSINLGSSTTEFGCYNLGTKEHLSAHSEYSGNRIDHAIKNRIEKSVGDSIFSQHEIRNMKENASLVVPKIFKVKGFSRNGIVEKEVSEEVTIPLQEYADGISRIVAEEVYNNIQPQVRKSILDTPIIISGGMSNIEGLPELIADKISEKLNHKIEFRTSNIDNHIAPAIGALMLCEEIMKEE